MAESVWSYPRPPRLEETSKHVQVTFGGVVIAETRRAMRVLETSHPPTYYVPPEDVRQEYLNATPRQSLCEWKGEARYYDVEVDGRRAPNAAWAYPSPVPAFLPMAGYVAFYPAAMGSCTIDGEKVEPQPGGFYGGWVTSDVEGPFKGEAGTENW